MSWKITSPPCFTTRSSVSSACRLTVFFSSSDLARGMCEPAVTAYSNGDRYPVTPPPPLFSVLVTHAPSFPACLLPSLSLPPAHPLLCRLTIFIFALADGDGRRVPTNGGRGEATPAGQDARRRRRGCVRGGRREHVPGCSGRGWGERCGLIGGGDRGGDGGCG